MKYEILTGVLRSIPIGYRISDDGYDITLMCVYDMKHYSSLSYYHRRYQWEVITDVWDIHFEDMPSEDDVISSEQGWFPHIVMTKELKQVGFYGI